MSFRINSAVSKKDDLGFEKKLTKTKPKEIQKEQPKETPKDPQQKEETPEEKKPETFSVGSNKIVYDEKSGLWKLEKST